MNSLAKLPLETADLRGGLALLRCHLSLSPEHRGYVLRIIWISAVPKDRLHVKGVIELGGTRTKNPRLLNDVVDPLARLSDITPIFVKRGHIFRPGQPECFGLRVPAGNSTNSQV
jgi:hypothetical protein